jgi:hypothetical protein
MQSIIGGDSFLSIGRLACLINLLRAIPGTHPSGLLRSESPPPGYDFLLSALVCHNRGVGTRRTVEERSWVVLIRS